MATLPVENISPAELKLKDQYMTRVAAAEAEIRRLESNPTVIGAGHPNHPVAKAGTMFPWMRAAEMIPQLKARGELTSSVRVSRLLSVLKLKVMGLHRHI